MAAFVSGRAMAGARAARAPATRARRAAAVAAAGRRARRVVHSWKPLLSSPAPLLAGPAREQLCGVVCRAEDERSAGASVAAEEECALPQDTPAAEICDTTCSADPPPPEFNPEYNQTQDLQRAFAVAGLLGAGGVALGHNWVADHEAVALGVVFLLGYAGIIFEETFAFNKSGVALLTAVGMWTVRAVANGGHEVEGSLSESLADVSQIVFFLMGAMTIVETVDAHQGFKIVTDSIKTRDRTTLLWLIGGITFFMSAILDNLTSTIVMVSLLRKLVPDEEDRKFFGAVVVIAANAGGAWTPIGDVTTTMLWINGQITTLSTMQDLLLPSLMSLVVPLGLLTALDGESRDVAPPDCETDLAAAQMAPRGNLVFGAGVASLVGVPIFKTVTGLPPYLGMLFGLGGLWLLTDAIHFGEDERESLRVPSALTKIDTQGVLFFLGILLAISSLDSSGVLKEVAVWLNDSIGNTELIATAIGLASAVIDNVPLVAATMGMYDVSEFPVDSELWQLIAYCAGTGGSILVIGSAAGVAYMGMEKCDFMWYTRRVSPWALSGYVAGIGTYLAMHGSAIAAALPAAQAALPQ